MASIYEKIFEGATGYQESTGKSVFFIIYFIFIYEMFTFNIGGNIFKNNVIDKCNFMQL